MEAPASNRRIGERLPTPSLSVTWEVTRKGKLRSKTVEEEVQVANASATGAALIAPTVPGLIRRSTVQLQIAGYRVSAKITRDEPTAIVGVTCYGIQFDDAPHEVIDYLLSHGGADDRDQLESLWRRAH